MSELTTQTTNPIYANKMWNQTGVILEKGKMYQISTVSVLEPFRDANWESKSIVGQDWQGFWHKHFTKFKRKKNENWFALIGTIDKKHPWALKYQTKFIAPESGMLICYFNDVPIMYWNNSGTIILNIQESC